MIVMGLQVWIQDVVSGGASASEAKSCRHSAAESSAARVQGPETFGFLMLKYICIKA